MARSKSLAERGDVALDALGNPMRRRIVRILANGERAVGELAAELPVSRPAVSKHLTILRSAELVRASRRGTQTIVRLNPAGFSSARRWLDGFWDEALARFVALAEHER